MAEEATVPAKPKAAAPAAKGKGKRERSTIEFPYGDLNDAVEVAKAIHRNAGVECAIDQLAAFLGYGSINGGAFRTKVATARIFGLIESERQQYSLTELGRAMADPQQERQARADAFLQVPLYKAIHDKYRGHLLPPDVGLEREIASLGVSEKQTDKARQAFRRSAEQAGFFEQGRDRLVMPARVATRATGQEEPPPPPPVDESAGGKGLHNGGGGLPPDLHPFVKGLLDTLPKTGSDWSEAKREQWLSAARQIFTLIYTDSERERRDAELQAKIASGQ